MPSPARFHHVLSLVASAALLLAALLPLSAHAQGARRVSGELIVRLDPGAQSADLTADPALAADGLVAKRLLVPALNIWLFGFDEAPGIGRSADATLDAVRRHPAVAVAQFNHEASLRAEARNTVPNDPRFDDMWNLDNTGQTGGTPDADVDAPEAWDLTTGGLSADGDRVAVGVVDCGFDLDHPDLRFWTNPAETPNNRVDDDGNGYVDDVEGWNAYSHNGNVTSCDHGTHVAGTAAARGNNGLGVTGINWDAEAVAIQGSSGSEATVVEAYGYALALRQQYDATGGAEGAFVVSTNSSFGVDFGQPEDYPIWCGMYDEMGAVGILSAAATANININIDTQGDIPTACPSEHMIAVTNTTDEDRKNSGAAYGLTTIDLGAPGTDILSTIPGGGYSSAYTGTSMATPHVAGAVALLVSGMSAALLQDYKANPAAVALTLKQALLDGTDDIGIQTVSGGRLNLYNSLLLLDQGSAAITADVEPVGSTSIPAGGGPLRLTLTLTNTTTTPQTTEVWTAISGPITRDPAFGPRSVTLAPGATLTGTLTQRIPATAPAGTYTYTVSVGAFPSALTSDSFAFEKEAGRAAQTVTQATGDEAGWAVTGWTEVAAAPTADLLGGFEPSLSEVRPNPFAGRTTLTFELPAASPVRLTVYDVLGREVARLVDRPLEAGRHEAVLDGARLPAGAYLVRLEAGGRVEAQRITLVR